MRLFWHQLRAEQLIFWRNRESAVFLFIFPVMLFVLLGSFYDGEIDGNPARDVLLVGMIGYGAANTGFAGMAITLVIRREYGILKRLRSTPLPAGLYFAASLGSILIVFALQTVTLYILGGLFYDTHLPEQHRGGRPARLPRCRRLHRPRARNRLADPLRRGSLRGRERDPAARWRSSRARSASATTPPCSRHSRTCCRSRTYIDLVSAAALDGDWPWSDPSSVAIVAAWGAAGYAVAARRFTWEPRER